MSLYMTFCVVITTLVYLYGMYTVFNKEFNPLLLLIVPAVWYPYFPDYYILVGGIIAAILCVYYFGKVYKNLRRVYEKSQK